jgi:hypothetical protein
MSSTNGSKVKDTEQEYQFSMPFLSPSGHEFSFYDTPENQRLVVRHTSGSHIEFKADGSVFLKSVKDIHQHSSVLSKNSEKEKGAQVSTQRVDTDLNLEVSGRLKLKANAIEIEAGTYMRSYAGTDYNIFANNVITKATENISLEGEKSIYVDTKEMRERVVSRQNEAGTMEDKGEGGLNIMKVYGNTVIQNDDETGGITIASKGYLNLVAGKERVDLTGKFTEEPSEEALGTFTNIVYEPEQKGELDESKVPGDYIFKSDAGAYYEYGIKNEGSSLSKTDGLLEKVVKKDASLLVEQDNRIRNIKKDSKVLIEGEQKYLIKKDQKFQVDGKRERMVKEDEKVTIQGTQTIKAKKIFLN